MIARRGLCPLVCSLGMLFLAGATPAGAGGKPLGGDATVALLPVVVTPAGPAIPHAGSRQPSAAEPAPPEQGTPTAAAPSDDDLDALFDDDELLGPEVYDPFESGNRAVFRFNQAVGQWVWDPVTRGYRFAVPGAARRAVRRAFVNLNAPIYVVNHVLRLDLLDAAETLGAFTMNTVFGFAGLLDTSSGVGLSLKPADFGQTLALAGVGSGPYLVFPVVGPTNVRDGFGFIVDRAFHPLTYVLAVPTQLLGYGGAGISRRDEAHEALKALESSLDPYAVVRSAYAQARQKEIEDVRRADVGSTAGAPRP